MAALVAEGIDWSILIDGARRHRATTPVMKGLRSCPGLSVPEAAFETLRRHVAANARQALAQASEVVAVCRLLAAADIPVIVLKGVALSQRLYGDLAVRGVGDIDLLVAPATFERAAMTLTAAGYLPDSSAAIGTDPKNQQPSELSAHRDIGFRHPERNSPIELHQRLTANPHRVENDFSTLWARRETMFLAGAPLATLPAATLPLYLCVHGVLHGWERLCWLADVAVLLETPEARTASLENARAFGLERSLTFVLALADALLTGENPGANADRETRRFLRAAYGGDRWRETPPAGSAAWCLRGWRYRCMIYMLKPGWRHLRNEIAADFANPIDRALFRLPAGLSWLYPFLRPFGWFYRNFIGK